MPRFAKLDPFAVDCESIKFAASNGHLEVLEFLAPLAKKLVQKPHSWTSPHQVW